ncbi:ATP-dependent DNA helicase pif1, partial [Choanephora cucurbitarum]
NALCNYFRSQEEIVLCVASSGIASLLLSGGCTSHFRFKMPIAINETSFCYITKKGHLADLLRSITLIIWDEVPMQNKLCFGAVDRSLKDICSSDKLLGSIPVVLGEDFVQIPPVIRNVEKLISKIHPKQDLDRSLENPHFFFKSAVLTTQNSVVDSLNEMVLDLMPRDSITLLSADTADTSEQENDEIHRLAPEYLQTLNPPSFPPAKLTLKKGCIVMFLRNLNSQKGLFSVLHEDGSGNKQIEVIPRVQLSILEDEYPFILTRKQFPVRLSFAMTINKVQGQSLENVGIDLRNPTFTHRQLYVALSRSTNLKGIRILHQPNSDNTNYSKIENIIYPELLLN